MEPSSGDDPAQSRKPSRRALLAAGLAGTAGIAAIPATDLIRNLSRGDEDVDSGLVAREYAFNTDWLFHEYIQGSDQPGYDDRHFTPVTLPHCVTALSWRDWNPAAWEKVWIYRKHFDGSGLLEGRVLLDFDGVMVNAAVVVNGQLAGSHQGGYLPWTTELTSYVHSGDNVLAVVVDSRCIPVPPEAGPGQPGTIDFLQPGGIYRDVRLRVVPDAYLADVFAQPTDVLSSDRGVDVRCTIDTSAAPVAPVQLTAVLSDHHRQIATVTRSLPGIPAGTTVADLRLTGLGGIGMWSPRNPKLYELTTTLSVRGGTHTVRKRIGFRQAEFRADGFYLNGQRLKIFGLNRHQLFPYTGMAMPARAQRRDAEILRNDFNCNMVRCSHYPQSPHFLDACDELGLMVWEEAPGWHHIGNAAWQDVVVQNVHDMVVRDRSRPSVIVWGTRLNETTHYAGLWQRTRQVAHELDGSRPATGAMYIHSTHGWHEDVFAYNDYHLSPDGRAQLRPPLPGVPYLISESVGVMDVRPRHYRWTDPPKLLAEQAVLHAQVHDIASSSPDYAGLLAWAAFDYASLLGPGGQRVKWAGVADGFRVAKPGAAIYLSQVDPRTRPVIVPVFFWDLAGGASPAGPGPDTMIATNCDQVEVFVGGQHAGTGRPVLDAELYGHLKYPPTLVDLTVGRTSHPELRIEGYLNGQQVAVAHMSADPAGDRLAMTADDQTITGDGSDATRVVFRAVDAYGNQRRYGTGYVRLRAEGPVDLIGDNPFEFGAYGGLGAVWARSRPGQSGPVTITAQHPVLGQARVQLNVVRAARIRIA